MNWGKAIGFAILLWALMFVIVSIFIGFKIYGYLWMQVVAAVIGFIIALILASNVKPGGAGSAFAYGLIWVVIGLILDAAVTTRFNAAIFESWPVWLGYLLVLIAPLFRIKKA